MTLADTVGAVLWVPHSARRGHHGHHRLDHPHGPAADGGTLYAEARRSSPAGRIAEVPPVTIPFYDWATSAELIGQADGWYLSFIGPEIADPILFTQGDAGVIDDQSTTDEIVAKYVGRRLVAAGYKARRGVPFNRGATGFWYLVPA